MNKRIRNRFLQSCMFKCKYIKMTNLMRLKIEYKGCSYFPYIIYTYYLLFYRNYRVEVEF